MKIEKTEIEGLLIVSPTVIGDSRGWFFESYSFADFLNHGISTIFVQDNHSYSEKKGIIRGLHCQVSPHSQSKLVRCTRGKIIDYAVDVRKSSKTFLKWFSIELSEENKIQLFIPKGFLHGFKTLTDSVEIQYKVDDVYASECDRSIFYADEEIGIDWNIENPILSKKDATAVPLNKSDISFE